MPLPFCLLAMLAMPADSLLQVRLGFLDLALALVVAVQCPRWHGAPDQEKRGKNCRQYCGLFCHSPLRSRNDGILHPKPARTTPFSRAIGHSRLRLPFF